MTAGYDVPYMLRTREYYRAQGYDTDYQWAHNSTTPFTKFTGQIDDAKIALVSTAMPDTEQGRTQRQVYATPCSPVPTSMYTSELSWDKQATHTEDVGSFLPISILRKLAEQGVVGGLTENFYSVPTDYSQRHTQEDDAPAILEMCRGEGANIALLVPL